VTTISRSELDDLLTACGAPEDAEMGARAAAVFADPWHAEVVATTLTLSRNGLFTWNEWVNCFSRHIARKPQSEAEDANTAYYRQWLAALEDMLHEKSLLVTAQIAQAQDDWRLSYLHTEHGQPVIFQRGLEPPSGSENDDHYHSHGGNRQRTAKPVTVSRATKIAQNSP
jgi:nitrile hydratase accessory protein